MRKEAFESNSLQVLTRHQKRIQLLVRRANEYSPIFDKNKNYTPPKKDLFRQKRKEQKKKLIQENYEIIARIECISPKISTRLFPKIKRNRKQGKSCRTILSRGSLSIKYKDLKDVFRNGEQIVTQNVRLLDTLEAAEPKIDCWKPMPNKKMTEFLDRRKTQKVATIKNKLNQIALELKKIKRHRQNYFFNSKQTLNSQKTNLD